MLTRKQICDKARDARRLKLQETFPKRFWERVDKNGPIPKHVADIGNCWVWIGSVSSRGYGRVRRVGEWITATAASYQLENGAIPPGQYVLHKCDNPLCVRPSHLFVGTQADNIQDAVSKNRCHLQKLTVEKVKQIKDMAYKVPSKDIAQRFGVAPNTISAIITGASWAWLKWPVHGVTP